ncbi:hypothetical protein Chor_001458, partial [Crotalus horridus]
RAGTCRPPFLASSGAQQRSFPAFGAASLAASSSSLPGAARTGAMASLTPQVRWAQRHPELYLRVELSDVQDPDITITDNVLHFKAHGHGAKGDNIYTFQIEFLEPVNPQPVCRVTQRQLSIMVKKKESHWWERLTKQEKRPLFLTPDFDRWQDESDAELELKAKEEERINKIIMKNRMPKDPFRHLKRGYLFMYNLVQFLGYSWIFVNMTVRLFMLGKGKWHIFWFSLSTCPRSWSGFKDSFSDTFHMSGDMMYFCQMFSVMEIVNALIGLIKTPLAPLCLQIFGRNFTLFVVLGSLEEMQSKAVVFFIFYIWSTVEIIRYPYYLLSSIDIEWKILTWLRYSIWMPLYPLGMLAEAVAVIQAVPVFNSTGKFSFTLNYPLSITVPFSVFLQLNLIIFFLESDQQRSLMRIISIMESLDAKLGLYHIAVGSIEIGWVHTRSTQFPHSLFLTSVGPEDTHSAEQPPATHRGHTTPFILFRHMYKQRQRRLGPKKRKMH